MAPEVMCGDLASEDRRFAFRPIEVSIHLDEQRDIQRAPQPDLNHVP